MSGGKKLKQESFPCKPVISQPATLPAIQNLMTLKILDNFPGFPLQSTFSGTYSLKNHAG